MTLWRGDKPLVLASRSPSRQQLLKNAGIDFQVAPADLDERAVQDQSGLSKPGLVAVLLASSKAAHGVKNFPGHFVLGADQTLALDDSLFSKPSGRVEAGQQLKRLSGRTHELHSALALARDGDMVWQTVTSARLTMRTLSDAAIATYLDAAGDKVTTSVGAYQVEGLGIHLFERIEGDHFTILGLPLLPLLDFLRRQGLLAV
jgi:nucleoside triphosphate pyrophosphatase